MVAAQQFANNFSSTGKIRICDPYFIFILKFIKSISPILLIAFRHQIWSMRKECMIAFNAFQYPRISFFPLQQFLIHRAIVAVRAVIVLFSTIQYSHSRNRNCTIVKSTTKERNIKSILLQRLRTHFFISSSANERNYESFVWTTKKKKYKAEVHIIG